MIIGKTYLKRIRWLSRRLITAVKVGPARLAHSPIVFGNAMPKSGSHLLTQILGGLKEIGPFIDPGFPPVNRDERNRPLNTSDICRNIQKMKPGDIRYGYIHAVEPYLTLLTEPGFATFFIYRDPRDMLVSHIFFATEMYSGHGMHQYYSQKLNSMEERINAAIVGVSEQGYELSSVKQRYDSYLGWFKQPHIKAIKFEDLILRRRNALKDMIDYLVGRGAKISHSMDKAINVLEGSILPAKSGTFRKGIPGEWEKYFSNENKKKFKDVAGSLLQKLGYEDSDDW